MKYFVGVVPEDLIYNTVLSIQKKFGDNRLEPHITIRPPVTVAEQTQWIEAIEIVCADFSPIHVELPATGNFGKGFSLLMFYLKSLANCITSF